MAVTLETNIQRWRGLSTDTKPESFRETRDGPLRIPREGSSFTETDTGKRFVWHDGGWERQEQTVETALMEIKDVLNNILGVIQATHTGHEEHTWGEEVPIGQT